MRLSAWPRKTGLSYKTAWGLWKIGKLPLLAEQLAMGTVIVHERPVQASNVALYGRVSSSDLRQYGKRAASKNRVEKAKKVLLL